MTTWGDLVELVEERARGRCEYCGMHQALQGATFHVEHIVPRSRGGSDDMGNLAWSCPGCNLRKSDRVDGLDSDTNVLVPLFNPRTAKWDEHFRWDGFLLIGQTATGRATVVSFDLNHPRRLLIRQAEKLFGMFPPRA